MPPYYTSIIPYHFPGNNQTQKRIIQKTAIRRRQLYRQSGVLDGIRIHDLTLRRRTLYPAELQGHLLLFYPCPSCLKSPLK